MPFGEAPSRARRIPRDGDVLVSTVRTYLKAIAPVASPASNMVASTGFAVARPGPDLQPGFLKYALQEEHFIQQVISRSTGISYPAINASDIARISLCMPGSSEQQAIATFLDRETAKIDALIAEQQRLIALLQEKRQAVISHAMTKGLNSDAPMKNSGVKWLGEVPEHWEILEISKITSKITNGYVGPTRDILIDEGIPYIQATHIKRGCINFDSNYYVTAEWSANHAKSVLREGEVLVVQTGAGTGEVGLVSAQEAGFNCHSQVCSGSSSLLDRRRCHRPDRWAGASARGRSRLITTPKMIPIFLPSGEPHAIRIAEITKAAGGGGLCAGGGKRLAMTIGGSMSARPAICEHVWPNTTRRRISGSGPWY
jgi:hypothetical protein